MYEGLIILQIIVQLFFFSSYLYRSIYYLIADFHFKSRDFSKAIRFYILDLTLRPQRFDSWAGLALSKSAKIEAKLNSCDDFK